MGGASTHARKKLKRAPVVLNRENLDLPFSQPLYPLVICQLESRPLPPWLVAVLGIGNTKH